MQGDAPVSWLMFFTLGAAVIIAAIAFMGFLRSRRNRDIASTAVQGDRGKPGAMPHGVGPELAAVFVAALVVMGLLVAGYASKSPAERDQAVAPVGGPSTTGVAPAGSSNPRPQ